MTCYSMGASTSYSAGIEMMIAISICKICMRDLEVWFDSVAYTDVEQTPAYSMESGAAEMEPQQQRGSKELQLTEMPMQREGSSCKAHKKAAQQTAFNSISTTASYPVTSYPVTSVCAPPVCSQVTCTSSSSSPSLVGVLQMRQHSPEVIQLSKPARKPKHQPVTVSKSSLESFTNLKLQNLFSVVSESVQQGQSQGKLVNSASSLLNTTSGISGEPAITSSSKSMSKAAVAESKTTIHDPTFTGAPSHSPATLPELVKVGPPVYVSPCCSLVSSNSTETSTVVHSKDSLIPRGTTVTLPIQPMARGSISPSYSGPPAVSHGCQPADQLPSATIPQLERLSVASTSQQPPVVSTAGHPVLNLTSAVLPAIHGVKPV